jgi:hypothetical protein
VTDLHKLDEDIGMEHLRQARSAAEAVATEAADGSHEALLADAVRNLLAAFAEHRPGRLMGGTVTPPPISESFAYAVVAILAKKYPDLQVTLDELLVLGAQGDTAVDAVYDPDQRAWRIKLRGAR